MELLEVNCRNEYLGESNRKTKNEIFAVDEWNSEKKIRTETEIWTTAKMVYFMLSK